MDLRGKKITVVGLGDKTGVSLVRYLSKVGAKPFVTEIRGKEEVREAWQKVSYIDAEFEFGGHSSARAAGSTMAILCPGVPIDSPFAQEISKKGIKVISELEFAFRCFQKGRIVGVTGTNGKSTTVTMIGDILKKWGKTAFVGGNLGTPFVEALEGGQYEVVVLEVSTFQLEGMEKFRPDIGVLLNISENHLDRHGTMDKYVSLKLKFFENERSDDVAVLNLDDPYTDEIASRIRGKKLYFSTHRKDADIFIEDGYIRGRIFKAGDNIVLGNFSLRGMHNASNFLAATLACSCLGCPMEIVRETTNDFKPLPHRIEFVREVAGVEYYDDSKSTTVDSTARAIESFDKKLILVAGGRDKGSDFKPLKNILPGRVGAVVLYGEAAPKLETDLGDSIPSYREKNFREAVLKARELASAGEIVLLSPANSSFDLFRDYKERGNCFKEIVNEFSDGK